MCSTFAQGTVAALGRTRLALQEESILDRQMLLLVGSSAWTDFGTLKVAHGSQVVVASDGKLAVTTASGKNAKLCVWYSSC